MKTLKQKDTNTDCKHIEVDIKKPFIPFTCSPTCFGFIMARENNNFMFHTVYLNTKLILENGLYSQY